MNKNLIFSFIICVIFFITLESVARFFTVPGAAHYIEQRIMEEGLTAQKPKGEYRVLMFGESTMHGNHLFPKSTIGKWVELYLGNLIGPQQAKHVKVVNLGRCGASSDYISQAFFDTIAYKPDLVIFYTVHNDFIELENRQLILNPKSLSVRMSDFFEMLLKKSCFVSAVKRMYIKIKMKRKKDKQMSRDSAMEWFDERTRAPHNKNTDLLEPKGDDFGRVQAHWENNVKMIINVAQKNHIPVIFLEGAAKYKEYEPFESVHAKTLTDDQLMSWNKYYETAEEQFKNKNFAQAVISYKQSLEVDPEYALTYFRLGECFEQLSDYELAKKYYFLANEKDRFPIRAPGVVNQFYDQLAAQNLSAVHVVKTQELFDQYSAYGMVDSDLILDQIHPTIKGQSLIALEIVKWLSAKKEINSSLVWNWDQLESMEELEQGLNIDRDFEFLVYIYSARYVGRYNQKAIEYLKKALAIKPASIAAQSHLAWIYWSMGDEQEAIKLYRDLGPRDPAAATKFFGRHPEIATKVNLEK